MQIYGLPLSPFVQRVLMVVRAKGADVPLNTMPNLTLQSPEFLAISPMGRIPVLELDDGTHLCESGAIATYLDETLSGPSILPADPLVRAKVRALEDLVMLEVAAGARAFMVYLVFKRGEAPEVVAAARAQFEKGLDAIEQFRNPADHYLLGDTLTPADCAFVPILQLLEAIDPMADTQAAVKARPGIAAYFERMRSDPIASQTMSEMVTGFAAMMKRMAGS